MDVRDSRAERLAEILAQYSVAVKPGDKVLIEIFGSAIDLGRLTVEAVYRQGGLPFVQVRDQSVWRSWLRGVKREQLEIAAASDKDLMDQMDAYIGLRGWNNISEYADVPAEQMAMFQSLYGTPVHSEARVKGTRWCVLRYPNASMAQLANMSTEGFEDFYYRVCTLDYAKMNEAMSRLKERMERTDRVRVTGPGTDLAFSIKGIPAIPCAGQNNIPDGEVFTAPVRDSVEGTVRFNTPSPYHGFVFEGVELRFEKGRIVSAAAANDTERINQIFDTDEGARYVGEFSLGLNPHIKDPIKDILFDEKIDGSFHFTPGNCYDDAYNGNQSAIHWDLVCIQRPEYGGGEIWFDGELIRKDGRFVAQDLLSLNPEHLV